MKTIGIIGGGQLAQLLAMSADALGVETICFASEENCPAKYVSPIFIGELSDEKSLAQFAQQVDVITIENENIDSVCLKILDVIKPVCPRPHAIAIAQDRLFEKYYFRKLHIPIVDFAEVNAVSDLEAKNGFLKTRRLGYDGRGQIRITPNTHLEDVWKKLQKPAIFETFVDFETEVSQLIARNAAGDIAFFPLIENTHQEGMLRTSHFAHLPHLEKSAQRYARRLAESLNYVGVLAVEFFVKNNQLIANEMAPRVHNSGHLTIEGCNVSQFEQHLRAILNLPLIQPEIVKSVEMMNIIGEWPHDLSQFHRVYDYRKTPRKNRKLGHVIRNIPFAP